MPCNDLIKCPLNNQSKAGSMYRLNTALSNMVMSMATPILTRRRGSKAASLPSEPLPEVANFSLNNNLGRRGSNSFRGQRPLRPQLSPHFQRRVWQFSKSRSTSADSFTQASLSSANAVLTTTTSSTLHPKDEAADNNNGFCSSSRKSSARSTTLCPVIEGKY